MKTKLLLTAADRWETAKQAARHVEAKGLPIVTRGGGEPGDGASLERWNRRDRRYWSIGPREFDSLTNRPHVLVDGKSAWITV